MLDVQILSDFWIGLAGLIVAVSGIILTAVLRLYDYRNQSLQRRIDRIGDAIRKLQPTLEFARASYQVHQTNVPSLYSAVQQVSDTFREEIMYKGLQPDLKKVSPTMNERLKKLYVRFYNMYLAFQEKVRNDPKNQNPYFDELRENVVNDTEIKRLIEELTPMVNEWLEKHP